MNVNRDYYYSNSYKSLQRAGIQGWGNSLIDRLIEGRVARFEGMKILELGASSGEHLRFVSLEPRWDKYVGLDISPGISDPQLFESLIAKDSPKLPNITFTKSSAENIPFDDDSFDLVVSTCLLAHVKDPERVLSEARRVVKNSGQIVIGLPTDPGILNRCVKTLITYPKMRHLGIENPRLEYAREHINGVGNLLELIKFQFSKDSLRFHYFPFFFRSWNFNLAVVVNCNVAK